MAVNTAPIFSATGDIQWALTPLVAANTLYDGTGTNSVIVATAGASGSFVQRIRFKASGSTTATVGRIFINNGQSTGSAANNVLFDEITLAATTATQTAATATYELPLNFALPAGYQILATVGTAQTAGGWETCIIGGSYASI
jgi:hypothetical protein